MLSANEVVWAEVVVKERRRRRMKGRRFMGGREDN
jgi:hypothetical protein